MYKKRLWQVLDILIIILFIFFGRLIYVSNERRNEIVNAEQLEENKPYDLNYYKEYYSNEDIIGAIKIEGTKIDSLIVRSNDNEYYLNHSINKEYDIKGSIFIDYRTNLNSKQINIYGHNSKDYDLPFKELEKYIKKSFYDDHKIIEIWNGIETFKYKIFSIQIVTADYEHMNIDSLNSQEHIEKLSKSIYETNIKASEKDKILVLQTCNYNPKNSYLLIIAKKI